MTPVVVRETTQGSQQYQGQLLAGVGSQRTRGGGEGGFGATVGGGAAGLSRYRGDRAGAEVEGHDAVPGTRKLDGERSLTR